MILTALLAAAPLALAATSPPGEVVEQVIEIPMQYPGSPAFPVLVQQYDGPIESVTVCFDPAVEMQGRLEHVGNGSKLHTLMGSVIAGLVGPGVRTSFDQGPLYEQRLATYDGVFDWAGRSGYSSGAVIVQDSIESTVPDPSVYEGTDVVRLDFMALATFEAGGSSNFYALFQAMAGGRVRVQIVPAEDELADAGGYGAAVAAIHPGLPTPIPAAAAAGLAVLAPELADDEPGPLVQDLSRPPVFAQFTTAFTWHDRIAQGYDEAAHGPLGAVTIEADWLWELHAQIELLQRQQCEDVLTYVLPDGTTAELEAPLVLGIEHDVELWFQVRVLTMGGAEVLRLGGPESWRFLAIDGASNPWHLWRDWTPDQRLDYAGSGGHHEVWSGAEARAVTVTDPGVLAALSGASSVRVIVSGNYNADQAWTGPKLTRWDPVHLQLSGGLTAGVTASSNTYRRGWDLRLTYHPQED